MTAAGFAALLACGLATGAVAQDRAPRLAMYLNGSTPNGEVVFDFDQTGCRATASLTQTYTAETRRRSTLTFDFAALEPDSYEIGTGGALDIAQLNLSLAEQAEDVAVDILLITPDEGLRRQWREQGAECGDDGCAISISQNTVPLVVGGPNADMRAEFVLQDLRRLNAACATTEQG